MRKGVASYRQVFFFLYISSSDFSDLSDLSGHFYLRIFTSSDLTDFSEILGVLFPDFRVKSFFLARTFCCIFLLSLLILVL